MTPAPVFLAGVKRLLPETTTIFEGSFSLLHCFVKDDTLYRGVFARLLFPVTYPEQFITLRYTDDEDKIKEIGVIERLDAFPEDQQKFVRNSLAKQYHEKFITRIHNVKVEFGLLFFSVETNLGEEEFMMPWRQDRADDFGTKGKVLLDAHDNRYIIPNVQELPAKDRRKFTSYIYW